MKYTDGWMVMMNWAPRSFNRELTIRTLFVIAKSRTSKGESNHQKWHRLERSLLGSTSRRKES